MATNFIAVLKDTTIWARETQRTLALPLAVNLVTLGPITAQFKLTNRLRHVALGSLPVIVAFTGIRSHGIHSRMEISTVSITATRISFTSVDISLTNVSCPAIRTSTEEGVTYEVRVVDAST